MCTGPFRLSALMKLIGTHWFEPSGRPSAQCCEQFACAQAAVADDEPFGYVAGSIVSKSVK